MYITIFKDGSFGFTLEEDKEALQSVEISEDNYKEFFERQSNGKSQRVKNINGETFDEIFEEFTIEYPQEPSEIDLLKKENEEIKMVLDTILMDIL